MPVKNPYVRPEVKVLGSVARLTQGPIRPSILDGLTGQGENTQIGCQPTDYNGPDYKICVS